MNDTENSLFFNVKSKIQNNYIRIEVGSVNAAFKMVPGETHRVTILPNLGMSAKEYYLYLPESPNLKRLSFEMSYSDDTKISYMLKLQRKEFKKVSTIPLNETQLGGYRFVKQDIELRTGIYTLLLENSSPNQTAKVNFRFITNNLLEMEENGMRNGTLQRNGGIEQIQLMITSPGELNLTLYTCRGTLDVYLVEKNYLENPTPADLIISTQKVVRSDQSFSYQKLISEPGPVYITVVSRSNKNTEYKLVSKMSKMASEGSADDDVSVKQSTIDANSSYVNVKGNQILIRINTPEIDIQSLKKKYPDVFFFTFEVVAYIGVQHETNKTDIKKFFNSILYCSADFSNSSIFRNTVYLTIEPNKYREVPKFITIPINISPALMKELFSDGIYETAHLKGISSIKVNLLIYEEHNSEPVGIVVKEIPTYEFPLNLILKEMIQEEISRPFFTSIVGKVMMIFFTLIAMLCVLVVVYFCANKMASGYRPVHNVDEPRRETTSFEMGQGYPRTDESTTSNETVDKEKNEEADE